MVLAAGCSWLAEIVKRKFFDVLFVFVAVRCSCLTGVFGSFLIKLGLLECVVEPSDYFVIEVVSGVREVGCG